MHRLSVGRKVRLPRPNARYRLRIAIRCFMNHSSERGLACCASTLTAS